MLKHLHNRRKRHRDQHRCGRRICGKG